MKVLLTEELDRDTRAQFVAEANLMAQLSAHPYIVTIFHADVAADGRPYFVMEYCSGPSLAERYKREPFAVDDALRTGVRLVERRRDRPRRRHPAPRHQARERAHERLRLARAHRLRHLVERSRASCRCTPSRSPAERRGDRAPAASRRRHERAVVAARDVRGRPAARRAQRRLLARRDHAHAARRPHAVRDPGPAERHPRPHRPHRARRDHADRPRRRAALLARRAREGHGGASRGPLPERRRVRPGAAARRARARLRADDHRGAQPGVGAHGAR